MDDHLLICWRVEDLDNPITGSQVERCSICGEEVWVAPSSRKICEETELELLPICYQCFPSHMMTLSPDEEIEVQEITTDQVEELIEEVKRRRDG